MRRARVRVAKPSSAVADSGEAGNAMADAGENEQGAPRGGHSVLEEG